MTRFASGRIAPFALAAALAMGAVAAHASAGPDELRTKYGQLQQQLRHNAFGRELYVDSSQSGDTLRGDVYAVLDYPFAQVDRALAQPRDWCDVMLLPFNTKYCRAAPAGGDGAKLDVRIGRKSDQPVQDAYRLEFALRPLAANPDYFESRLGSPAGPFGTHDYRIVVAAIPIGAKRTFLHFSYSYAYGLAGKMAMEAYLATAGASKVGFTRTRDANGQPAYIGGMRGAIERTAMRYYLAIDAELASMSAPPDRRLETRLDTWFRETERYPRQLHEMDRATYLAMKRGEYGEAQQARADTR